MNKINFVKKNIRSRSRTNPWAHKGSLILCLSVLSAITTIQIIQWKTLRNVKQEKEAHRQRITSLDQLLDKKNRLEKEKATLAKGVQKIEQVKQNPDPFFALFGSINESLGVTGSLESLQISGKNLELTVGSPSIKIANQYMQTLAELPSVHSLDLISIRPHATQLLFKMKGTLN